jgi:hypothetical protein
MRRRGFVQHHRPSQQRAAAESRRGRPGRDRPHLAEEFVPAINAEVRALAREGATLIQIDEPAVPGLYGHDPHRPKDIARLFNACSAGVSGVKFALHICFGTYKKVPRNAPTGRIFPTSWRPRPNSSCSSSPIAKCPRSISGAPGRPIASWLPV